MPVNASRPPLPPAYLAEMDKWLGAELNELQDAQNDTACRGVRLHRVSTNPGAQGLLPIPSAIEKHLGAPVPWTANAFYIAADAPLGKLVHHELGAYYLQEPSAMAVVEALRPQPGERVLDLCAAPGGKTTAIGRRLQSDVFAASGLLVANEIHPTRVRVLGQNLERLGVRALVTNESPGQLATRWVEQFDAILVDAPCSGEGMFRKDPDARLAWSPDNVAQCVSRQRDILDSAVRMLRPGGRLVYSTCTFNPQENEQNIAWLRDNYEMTLLPLPHLAEWDEARPDFADGGSDLTCARRLWPHRGHGEGHFVALLQKGDSAENHRGQARMGTATERKGATRPGVTHLSAQQAREWGPWVQELASGTDVPDTWLTPTTVGDAIFTDESGGLPLDGLRILRPGVCLATHKGNRFEPHHQWAMSVQGNERANPLTHRGRTVDANEACAFIAGEVLDGGTGAQKSAYLWINVDGLPAGWAKQVPGRLNNLYPKGLRRTDLRPN